MVSHVDCAPHATNIGIKEYRALSGASRVVFVVKFRPLCDRCTASPLVANPETPAMAIETAWLEMYLGPGLQIFLRRKLLLEHRSLVLVAVIYDYG